MNLQDMFSVANLTAAVNKLPAVPGKVGAMGLFDEKGVTSTSVVIESPTAHREAETAKAHRG